MTLEHHRDLAHEFPELKQRIHDLKVESLEFRHLYTAYQALDDEIHRIEQEIETPSDTYTEDLKRRRSRLKDRLYGLLTGRLHLPPDTEEFVVRGKFRTPVDHGEVARDWSERGFSCATISEPAGLDRREDGASKDALMAVAEGRLDVRMHGVDYILEPGDEMFIPRGVPFSVVNPGVDEARVYVGLD